MSSRGNGGRVVIGAVPQFLAEPQLLHNNAIFIKVKLASTIRCTFTYY